MNTKFLRFAVVIIATGALLTGAGCSLYKNDGYKANGNTNTYNYNVNTVTNSATTGSFQTGNN